MATGTGWRVARWTCSGVIVASVVACIVMAAGNAEGLVAVKVTSIEPDTRPAGLIHIPFTRRPDVPPDYVLSVNKTNGSSENLGSRVGESASGGLHWRLNEPIPTRKIAGVRLAEDSRLLDKSLAEVQVTSDSAVSNGYRFDFQRTRSFSLGARAFFDTPIGLAISGAFFLAALIMIFSRFN